MKTPLEEACNEFTEAYEQYLKSNPRPLTTVQGEGSDHDKDQSADGCQTCAKNFRTKFKK